MCFPRLLVRAAILATALTSSVYGQLGPATYFGGSGSETINGIDTDAEGNVYVSGSTDSPDLPIVNALQPAFAGGGADCFVAKLNPTLTEAFWATYIGGSLGDSCTRLAVDQATGDVTVVGATTSPDFPGGSSPLGESDVVVFRISSDGQTLEYSVRHGGSGQEFAWDVAARGNGDACLTGWSTSTDYPDTGGNFTSNPAGAEAFVSCFTPAGELSLATRIGGPQNDIGKAISFISTSRQQPAAALGAEGSPGQGAMLATDSILIAGNTASGRDFLQTTELTPGGQASGDDPFVLVVGGSGSDLIPQLSDVLETPGTQDTWGVQADAFGKVTVGGASGDQGGFLFHFDSGLNPLPGLEGPPMLLTDRLFDDRQISTFNLHQSLGGDSHQIVLFGRQAGAPFAASMTVGAEPLTALDFVGNGFPNDSTLGPDGPVVGMSVDAAGALPAAADAFQPDFDAQIGGGVVTMFGTGQAPVQLHQVSWLLGDAVKVSSGTGLFTIDVSDVADLTGVPRGQLNATIDGEWVVRNLFYDGFDPLDQLSVRFPLPGADLIDHDDPAPGPRIGEVTVNLSAFHSPIAAPPQDFPHTFRLPVRGMIHNAVGEIPAAVAVPRPPVVMDVQPEGETFAFRLPGNEINVQAAANQCAPAAYANSLAWLESRYDDFDVPHDNVPGINGDNSLVGQLDKYMDRPVGDGTRTDVMGSGGVGPAGQLEGKFEYLNNNGLKDKLVHKHQGAIDGDYTEHGITSKEEGDNVTFDWLCAQLKAGEDVELGWTGHRVRVTGCGKTNGDPWIEIIDDRQQTDQNDPHDRLGTTTTKFELKDLDNDGNLNTNEGLELTGAVSESLTDEIKAQPGSPPFSLAEAITNAASFQNSAQPGGAIVTAFGLFPDLATAELKAEPRVLQSAGLPTALGGLTVRINGIAAPIYSAFPTQVSFQMPVEIEPGDATAVFELNGKTSGYFSIPVAEAAPGIFPLDASIAGPGRAVAQNQDFSLNVPGSGAAPGSAIVVYVTGLGAVDNPVPTGQPTPNSPLSRALATVTATIGGVEAQVAFAGLSPGFVGLNQVNIIVPELPPGDYPVKIAAAGIESNEALVTVE